MNEEMKWTVNSIISFICDLQSLPILWDNRITHQNFGRRKRDVWFDLAAKYSCSDDELKRKWQSLQAAYRREKMRELSSGGQYRSRWFAYHSMSFVGDRYKPRKYCSSSVIPEAFAVNKEVRMEENEEPFMDNNDPCEEEEQVEATEDVYTEENQPEAETTLESKSFVLPRSHLKKVDVRFDSDDNKLTLDNMYSIPKRSVHQEDRNECTIFGEFIAKKLSKLDDRLSAIVQHKIHNILFQAEMGHLTDYSLSTQNSFITSDLGTSPKSVHSPSSTSHHTTMYEVHQPH